MYQEIIMNVYKFLLSNNRIIFKICIVLQLVLQIVYTINSI